MDELRTLVERSRAGDLDAYGEIVRRFQDMACGYAYALLGDFHLAQDAAQEAFVQGYRSLGASPGCGRARRGRRFSMDGMDFTDMDCGGAFLLGPPAGPAGAVEALGEAAFVLEGGYLRGDLAVQQG
jgi:hypothetical protein